MLNILVVEDFDVLREELVWFLNRPGWQASGVGSGQALDAWLQTQRADMVVLDLNLPDEDGLSIARRLRQRWPRLGIVMLTARASHAHRAAGFASGADVYLSKPAQSVEIEAVIRNLQRRLQGASASTLAPVPALRLEQDGQRLGDATGAWVDLHPLDVRLLSVLAKAHPAVASADALLQALAEPGQDRPDLPLLRVRITRLRAKVKPMCGDHELIEPVRGQGYRLALPIESV
jgi:DNA-binding response OmpR family regulator